MLDPHRLRLLREVSERGTVTAAAEALGFTPSAVSQQLSVLERELGAPVLERRGRGVVLTAAGAALVATADDVFAALEHAEASAQAAAAVVAGEVVVGGFQSVGATLIPTAFARLAELAPSIDVHFRQFGNNEEGHRELRLGNFDITVDHEFTLLAGRSRHGVNATLLLTEPVYLAVPTGDDRGPDPAAYADRSWAASPPDQMYGELVRTVCQRAGFTPTVRYHTDDLEVIFQLTAAGVAVGVLPRLAAHYVPEGVTLHPLPDTERRVLAFTRHGTEERPAIAVVLDALRRAGEER